MANIYRRQLLMMAWLSLSLDAVLTACGSVSLDQGVVLENERREAIHDIQIIYGTVNIPRRPRTLGAKAGYEHDARMVVPGTTKVVWKTEDTTVHAVDVPLRGQIPYPSPSPGGWFSSSMMKPCGSS